MSAKKIRRGPILFVLIALLVAAIVYDGNASSSPASAARAGAIVSGPAVPPADALSTSWYCTEGTSAADGRADETILVASVADTRIDATITVMPGGIGGPRLSRPPPPPACRAHVRVADLVETPEPGVVVEVVGGQAVVSHQLDANGDFATEPCARDGSSDWYFASGTTLKGAQQYLVLFDPFGDDAIVDVTFVTDDGVQEPDALQALVVSRRSRVTIPVHEAVPRQRDVAIHVHAVQLGRVVAERSMLFDGTASDGEIVREGVALVARRRGTAPRVVPPVRLDGRRWQRAGGRGELRCVRHHRRGRREPRRRGDTCPAVAADPRTRRHHRRRGGTRPGGSAVCSHRGRARDAEGNAGPVVAEAFSWWPSESASTGAATAVGSTRPACRWVIAQPVADTNGVVVVLNPGVEAGDRRRSSCTTRVTRRAHRANPSARSMPAGSVLSTWRRSTRPVITCSW